MKTESEIDADVVTEEPEITGTLVLTTLLLIMIFGFWVMMYFTLLGR